MGVLEVVEQLSAEEIIRLKRTPEFRLFFEEHKSVVMEAKDAVDVQISIARLYTDEEKAINLMQIIENAASMTINKGGLRPYFLLDNIDQLRSVFEDCKTPLHDFKNRVLINCEGIIEGYFEKMVLHGRQIIVKDLNIHGGTFTNCQFGDNNSLNNFIHTLQAVRVESDQISQALSGLIEFRKSLEVSEEYDDSHKEELVQNINQLSKALIEEDKGQEHVDLKTYWQYIKNGVQTSAGLTTIIVGIGKILGFIG